MLIRFSAGCFDHAVESVQQRGKQSVELIACISLPESVAFFEWLKKLKRDRLQRQRNLWIIACGRKELVRELICNLASENMLHQWLVVICGALLFVSTTQASSGTFSCFLFSICCFVLARQANDTSNEAFLYNSRATEKKQINVMAFSVVGLT